MPSFFINGKENLMAVLKGIEPQTVFDFFEEICMIPHGSGNTRQLSAYLKKFAEEINADQKPEEVGIDLLMLIFESVQ